MGTCERLDGSDKEAVNSNNSNNSNNVSSCAFSDLVTTSCKHCARARVASYLQNDKFFQKKKDLQTLDSQQTAHLVLFLVQGGTEETYEIYNCNFLCVLLTFFSGDIAYGTRKHVVWASESKHKGRNGPVARDLEGCGGVFLT